MIICELCSHYGPSGECKLGLRIPKRMSCQDFGPTMKKFCADPKDFVNERQIIEMATFFGMKGSELKKVKLMASREEIARLETSVGTDQPFQSTLR
jgi:hypothetical protein